MTKTSDTPSPQKVRRRSAGGKPAQGWEWQKQGRRVRRADVGRLRSGAVDAHLSSVGGLVSFNAFTREHGLHRELRRQFGRLKTGRGVVYPMAAQMQLLVDAWVAGAQRVLDVEMLAADPLFVHLAGGTVPSIDVLYDDLRRFDPQALEDLEELMSQHGTGLLKDRRHEEIFIDIDTTVMPLFGAQEGARPGPNPRYHGRPSYHPILAHIAQTGTVLGARLRPGDTSLGERDVEDVEQWLDRARAAVGPRTLVTVRIDAGGDCASLLHAIERKGAWFLVKLKWTPQPRRRRLGDRALDHRRSRRARTAGVPGRRGRLLARGLGARVARLRRAVTRTTKRPSNGPLGGYGLLDALLRHQRPCPRRRRPRTSLRRARRHRAHHR